MFTHYSLFAFLILFYLSLCFLLAMSFEFDVIFIELQHLPNQCLCKCHLTICNFVQTLKKQIYICKNMKNLLKKVELIKKTFKKKNEQKRSQKIRIVKEIL